MKQQSGMAMVALAVLGAVLILVFGYLFGVSPQLSAAGIANEERDLAVQDNRALENQIEQLKKLELEVPGWQADIDAVAKQIPSQPDTEHLHRMLIDAATAAGVPWVEFRIEDISLMESAAAPAAETPAAPAEGDTTTEDAGTGDPTPTPTEPAAPATPVVGAGVQNLVAVQFTVLTEGHPGAVRQFFTNIYQQTRRFVTVTAFTIEGSNGADAAPGRPGLVRGDVTISISGIAFVLIDTAAPLEVDETGGVPLPVVPSPSPSPSPSLSPSPSASS